MLFLSEPSTSLDHVSVIFLSVKVAKFEIKINFFPYILIFFIIQKSGTRGAAECVSLMFLPHFDVLFDLLLNRRTATWNLFVYLSYIITHVILAFWLVLAYDLLKDRRIDDDSARFKFFLILNLNQSQFFAKLNNQSVRFILYRHQITSVLFSCLSKWRNLK